MNHYSAFYPHWEKQTTIRTRQRRIITDAVSNEDFFPITLQPLALHPKIKALPKNQFDILMIRSAYKYMNDIAAIETEIVIKATLLLANNKIPLKYTSDMQQDALTIVIDEAYHAYVAKDFIRQLKQQTGVQSIAMPKNLGLPTAIQIAKSQLQKKTRKIFELIAVCIADNTLTKDIAIFVNQKNVKASFRNVMKDHLLDEGRHAKYFEKILKTTWEQLSKKNKLCIANCLTSFIQNYLNIDNQINYDFNLLLTIGITHQDAVSIINETYPDPSLKRNDPILGNIIKLLDRAGVFSDLEIKAIFDQFLSNLTEG